MDPVNSTTCHAHRTPNPRNDNTPTLKHRTMPAEPGERKRVVSGSRSLNETYGDCRVCVTWYSGPLVRENLTLSERESKENGLVSI